MAERSKFQFRMPVLLWAVTLIGMSIGLAKTKYLGLGSLGPLDQ